jgi:hypothetical protein
MVRLEWWWEGVVGRLLEKEWGSDEKKRGRRVPARGEVVWGLWDDKKYEQPPSTIANEAQLAAGR